MKEREFVFFSSCRKVINDSGTEIDTERQSQELKDSMLRRYGDAVLFEHIPRPEKKHFTDQLKRIGNQEVSLHFSGHGDERGLCWHWPPCSCGRKKNKDLPSGRKKNKEMHIPGKQLANLVAMPQHGAVEKIDCFFLNACCTLSTGIELYKIGVRVVVCWKTTVTDSTARHFATRFYEEVDLSVRPDSMPRPSRWFVLRC